MDFKSGCFVLLCALFLTAAHGSDEDVRVIPVNGFWKKIFEEENNSSVSIFYSRQWSYGLKTEEIDESTVRATHSIEAGVSTGDLLKIVSIDLTYGYENSVETRQVRGTEIQRMKSETIMFEVPPRTKLVRWQFVVDIVGNEFDDRRTLSVSDNTIPKAFNVTATVRLRKMIRFGVTPVRLRHKITGKYIIIVTRDNWPATTLGLSNRYHFIISDSGTDGVTIRTLNSTYRGYDYLYTWKDRWVYGDKFRFYRRCKRLYWSIDREPPHMDGDSVSFRNRDYSNRYLHYNKDDRKSNVECREDMEDLWILEVV